VQRRIDVGIEIQVELRMELAILNQSAERTVFNPRGARLIRVAFAKGLGEAVFRTRVSAEDIFRAAIVRLPIDVNDDVSKAGLGHDSTPV
jgi:hypothetical protein